MNHRSMPSLSSSISSNDTSTNNSPRTSTSANSNYNCNYNALDIASKKRHSEPTPPTKRWDDSQLEMELAEDDLIYKGKVRRNSSLRFKQTLQLSESIKEKFRHRQQQQQQESKLSRSLKRVRDWLF
ncbi:unnamed protein product [Mucor circinelloides]